MLIGQKNIQITAKFIALKTDKVKKDTFAPNKKIGRDKKRERKKESYRESDRERGEGERERNS